MWAAGAAKVILVLTLNGMLAPQLTLNGMLAPQRTPTSLLIFDKLVCGMVLTSSFSTNTATKHLRSQGIQRNVFVADN
jgi:hypothetical protein